MRRRGKGSPRGRPRAGCATCPLRVPAPSLALSFPLTQHLPWHYPSLPSPAPRQSSVLGHASVLLLPPAHAPYPFPCPCPLPRPPAPAPGPGSPAMAATRAMHRRRAWGSRPETRGGARCTGGRAGAAALGAAASSTILISGRGSPYLHARAVTAWRAFSGREFSFIFVRFFVCLRM